MPLDCDRLFLKCQTKLQIEAMLKQRNIKRKRYGKLGPVQFESLETFANRFKQKSLDEEATNFRNYYCKNFSAVMDMPDEILVIGDIHGDLLSFVTALRLGGVLDANLMLQFPGKGKTRYVVQMGDLIDRKVRSTSVDTTTSANPREEIDLMQMI